MECGSIYDPDSPEGCDQYCTRSCAEAAFLGNMSDRLYDEQKEYNLCQ